MTIFKKLIYCIAICGSYVSNIYAQSNEPIVISLNNLEAFNNAGKDWITVSSISADVYRSDAVKFTKGSGILINTAKKNGDNIVTKQEFGDVELNFDFMMNKLSNSAIYFEGRYGIKLADSWAKQTAALSDMGAIIQRTNESGQSYEGTVPLINAVRAPGLWQHLKIIFRAPKFRNNVKVKNARFEEVYLNGILIQMQNEITGPVSGAIFKNENASGPLMFRGDGGIVAFRNISLLPLQPEPGPADPQNPLSRRRDNIVNPIILSVENKPYLLRSYLEFNHKKLTHAISVGTPDKLSYSYDLKEGALIQVWRGPFLDVTEMWNDRGEPQLAKPLGSILALSPAPAIAFLKDKNAAWPDSIAFDDFQNKGYVLDKSRMPAFLYTYNGADVNDKIMVQNNGESLQRTITITNGTDNLYCRIAVDKTIETLKNSMYGIGDKAYFIKIDDGFKPIIRNTKDGQELIVPIGKSKTPLTYSLIW